MPYNYQKHPYRAQCIKWDGENTQDILKLFDEASIYGDAAIMVRWQEPITQKCGITTMYKNWWVVTGEDGRIRIYNPERFKILYEQIREK